MNTQKSFRYGLSGKFRAKEGKSDQLVAILLKAAESVSNAAGCLLYIVCQDSSDEQIIWVNEVWETKEDHDNSLHFEGIQELISQALPLIDGKPEQGIQLRVLGGLGIAGPPSE
ncbi:MAG: antibiotic biosynthesis monooxygenase [Balneolaceae bacterium]|nr:antibiotic biosynthesis monooxygenase [Balneolaceae bacterium]